MTYRLRNGYTVRTTNVDTGTEFETRNADGEVVSTVRLSRSEANALVRKLAGA